MISFFKNKKKKKEICKNTTVWKIILMCRQMYSLQFVRRKEFVFNLKKTVTAADIAKIFSPSLFHFCLNQSNAFKQLSFFSLDFGGPAKIWSSHQIRPKTQFRQDLAVKWDKGIMIGSKVHMNCQKSSFKLPGKMGHFF